MNLRKATDVLTSVPAKRRSTATARPVGPSGPWNLDLTIEDVMVDLDPGTLAWRERERDQRL